MQSQTNVKKLKLIFLGSGIGGAVLPISMGGLDPYATWHISTNLMGQCSGLDVNTVLANSVWCGCACGVRIFQPFELSPWSIGTNLHCTNNFFFICHWMCPPFLNKKMSVLFTFYNTGNDRVSWTQHSKTTPFTRVFISFQHCPSPPTPHSTCFSPHRIALVRFYSLFFFGILLVSYSISCIWETAFCFCPSSD